MSKSEKCTDCRYNEGAGFKCTDCNDGDGYCELKRVDPTECETCAYETDPCHYICEGCQDSNNWEPKPALEQILRKQIEEHNDAIARLEAILERCRRRSD